MEVVMAVDLTDEVNTEMSVLEAVAVDAQTGR